MAFTTTQHFSAWNAGVVAGSLIASGGATFGTRGEDTRVILGEQYTDDATPNRGTLISELFFQKGIIQGGADDNVVALNINRTIGGNRPNTNEPGLCVIQGESNFDVNADGEDADNQWEVNIGESVEDDPDDGRRAVAIAGSHTSKAIFISTCGTYTHWNSDRSSQVASITEAGQLQIADCLYVTVGGAKNLIQVEKATPGSTWVPLALTAADKLVLDMADVSAADGDIRFGDSFDWKWLISGATRSIFNAASGILNIGENHSSLAGINITVPTSGSGVSWYLATQQVLQAAFDGLYVAKQGKVSFHGNSPQTQFSTTGQTSGFTAGSGTAAKDDSTYTGGTGTKAYTVGDIVRFLKLRGDIASS